MGWGFVHVIFAQGHVNLLCIVPILFRRDSQYGWAGQYADTSLFVKFRCGTVVRDAQNIIVSHDLYRLREFMGVHSLKVRVVVHFSVLIAFLVSLFVCGYVLYLFIGQWMKGKFQFYLVFYWAKLEEKISPKFGENLWNQQIGEKIWEKSGWKFYWVQICILFYFCHIFSPCASLSFPSQFP